MGPAEVNYKEMVRGMKRFKDIENNMATDSINMEKYVKELSKVCWDMSRTTGAMFEQEHLRLINMMVATACGGNGRGHKFNERVMENKIMKGLAVAV